MGHIAELSEDDIGHDLGVEDQGFSEVFEGPSAEFKIFNDNDASEMDAPSMSMAKQDARTMAMEVLAKRFEASSYSFASFCHTHISMLSLCFGSRRMK